MDLEALDGLPNAELAVLGAIVGTSGEALDELALTGDDFNDGRHGDLFDSMRKMRASGQPVDVITLAEAFPKHAAFIYTLTEHTPFRHNVAAYSEIVASHGMQRRLRAVAEGLMAMPAGADVGQMVDRARTLVDEAVGTQRERVRFVRDILPEVIDRMERGDLFVPTPWKSLNEIIGGLRPGAVYVIGARPGIGKTVVAAQIAAELSKRGVVAFASLEMSSLELVGRLISERLGIYVGKVKDGNMSIRDWETLANRRHEVADLDIAIDDRAAVTSSEIRSFARSASRHGPLAGVVVDYLQLMSSTTKADRHVQVSEFSRQMKVMAKDMNVPVLLLSQLNRQSESSAAAVPKLSELRESGAIEQDADVVILLAREDRPWSTPDDPQVSLKFDVAKNRHGRTDIADLRWRGEFSRVEEW